MSVYPAMWAILILMGLATALGQKFEAIHLSFYMTNSKLSKQLRPAQNGQWNQSPVRDNPTLSIVKVAFSSQMWHKVPCYVIRGTLNPPTQTQIPGHSKQCAQLGSVRKRTRCRPLVKSIRMGTVAGNWPIWCAHNEFIKLIKMALLRVILHPHPTH